MLIYNNIFYGSLITNNNLLSMRNLLSLPTQSSLTLKFITKHLNGLAMLLESFRQSIQMCFTFWKSLPASLNACFPLSGLARHPLPKKWAGNLDASTLISFEASFACLTFLCFPYSQTDAKKATPAEISILMNKTAILMK